MDIDKIEEDLAKHQEEDLSDVDLGLTSEDEIALAAQERLQLAMTYERWKLRLLGLRVTIKMTSETKQLENLTKQEADINTEMRHCLRSIREIDKFFPDAKSRMSKIARV